MSTDTSVLDLPAIASRERLRSLWGRPYHGSLRASVYRTARGLGVSALDALGLAYGPFGVLGGYRPGEVPALTSPSLDRVRVTLPGVMCGVFAEIAFCA